MQNGTQERRIIDPQLLMEDKAALQLILNSLTQEQLSAVQMYSLIREMPVPSGFVNFLSERLDEKRTEDYQLTLDVAQLMEWALISFGQLSRGEVLEIITLYYTSGHPTDFVLNHKGEVSKEKIEKVIRRVAWLLADFGLLNFDKDWNLVLGEKQ